MPRSRSRRDLRTASSDNRPGSSTQPQTIQHPTYERPVGKLGRTTTLGTVQHTVPHGRVNDIETRWIEVVNNPFGTSKTGGGVGVRGLRGAVVPDVFQACSVAHTIYGRVQLNANTPLDTHAGAYPGSVFIKLLEPCINSTVPDAADEVLVLCGNIAGGADMDDLAYVTNNTFRDILRNDSTTAIRWRLVGAGLRVNLTTTAGDAAAGVLQGNCSQYFPPLTTTPEGASTASTGEVFTSADGITVRYAPHDDAALEWKDRALVGLPGLPSTNRVAHFANNMPWVLVTGMTAAAPLTQLEIEYVMYVEVQVLNELATVETITDSPPCPNLNISRAIAAASDVPVVVSGHTFATMAERVLEFLKSSGKEVAKMWAGMAAKEVLAYLAGAALA